MESPVRMCRADSYSVTRDRYTARVRIRDHHQRAIDRLADAYRDDPHYRALIIGGSVAKGYAREDSDVDFLIVATDKAFERRRAARDFSPAASKP